MFIISTICLSLFSEIAYADALSVYSENLNGYLFKIQSGQMDVSSLGQNVMLENMVALKRGVTGNEIGYVIIETAQRNTLEVNMQLGAVLGATGTLIEVGSIEGGKSLAREFYDASCEFAKVAQFSDAVVSVECSR